MLDRHQEVSDVGVHLEAQEVRIPVVMHSRHVLKVGLRPRDDQLRVQQSLDLQHKVVFQVELQVVSQVEVVVAQLVLGHVIFVLLNPLEPNIHVSLVLLTQPVIVFILKQALLSDWRIRHDLGVVLGNGITCDKVLLAFREWNADKKCSNAHKSMLALDFFLLILHILYYFKLL